jgi:hypothetical protein
VFNGRVDQTVGEQSRSSIRRGGVPARLAPMWARSSSKRFKNAEGAASLQAGRFQRLLCFYHSIACTIATLAYGVVR